MQSILYFMLSNGEVVEFSDESFFLTFSEDLATNR